MSDTPLWGAVLIAKNEASQIERCLSSAADAGIEVVTLLDTGSSDNTVELAESMAKGLGLDLRVHRTEFRNFGQARTEAFALARGTASWLAALDCDMSITIESGYVPDPATDALMVELGSADFNYRLPLALNGSLPWKSVGAVHEYTTLPDRAYVGVPTDKVRVTMHGDDRSSAEKSRWHAEMLEASLAEHPDNARDVFYLANTYWDLHDPRALAMYERRMKMGGYVEEAWYSMYRYALLLPTWPAQMQALIKAWEFRPQRLEPLYELIKGLNAIGQHHLAYRLSTTPIIQTKDLLFVHTSVWRWGMDFERSIAAFYVTGKDECGDICDRLLKGDLPPHIRDQVEKNKAFC